MKALIYSRVSTSDKGQKPEVQAAELRRYCEARGWAVAQDLTDEGYSGGTHERPGLKRLIELARGRRIDAIVVTKLDRLARSLRHLVTLLDEFGTLGIQFVSIKDQIDLTTASGRLMLHIVGAFAEFERCLIKERTIAGLDHARRSGKRLGRPKTRNDAAILKLRAQGLSYTQIQIRLGISRPAVHRALVAAGGTKTPLKQAQKGQSLRGGKDGQNG